MTISLRQSRAALYSYDDRGADGVLTATYVLQASDAADTLWWCARMQPTGRESTVGMKPEHSIDAIFAFDSHAPVSENGAITLGSEQYLVRAILARDYGRREVQVYAERAAEELELVTV